MNQRETDNSVTTSYSLPSIKEELNSFNFGIVLLASYFILEFGSLQGLYIWPNTLRLPLITAVISICYAAYALINGQVGLKYKSTKVLMVYLLFMILYAYSETMDERARSAGIKLYLMYGVSYIVMLASVKELKQLILIIDIWLASTAYTSLHGILQGGLVWGNQWVHDENQFAVMCSTCFPFAFFLFLKFELKIKKACYLFCMILYLGGCVMAASRGGILSMGLVGVFCWFYNKYKLRSLIMISVLMIAVLSFAPSRFFTETHNMTSDEQQGNVGERLYLWHLAINMFKDNKLLGVGPFNYGDYFVRYDRKAEWRDTLGGVTWRGQKWVAHSTPMTFMAETGIVGVALIILLQYALIKNWQSAKTKMAEKEDWFNSEGIHTLFVLSNAGMISMVGFWAGSLFLTLNWYPFFYCIVWFFDTTFMQLDSLQEN